MEGFLLLPKFHFSTHSLTHIFFRVSLQFIMTFVNKDFICRHWVYLLVIGALEGDILKIKLIQNILFIIF